MAPVQIAGLIQAGLQCQQSKLLKCAGDHLTKQLPTTVPARVGVAGVRHTSNFKAYC